MELTNILSKVEYPNRLFENLSFNLCQGCK